MVERSQLDIPIQTPYGETILHIVAGQDGAHLYEADAQDRDDGLAQWQLVEGASYQYVFDSLGSGAHRFQFQKEDELVRYSSLKSLRDTGTLRTGILVGRYEAQIVEIGKEDIAIASVAIEIRSVKTDYMTDYRTMLEDIAESYTDLVLQQGSPVTQLLEIDEQTTSESLYQRFCFVRAIIASDSFQEAMHKIMSTPVRRWADSTRERSIVGIRRLTRKSLRAIAASADRTPLPPGLRNVFPAELETVPRRLESEALTDTIDNSSNQFVKFALSQFEMFCTDLSNKPLASNRLREEVLATREQISGYLESPFFRLVSQPTHLALNSPVLQRKEGYREVFQKWLLFDLAAKLNWRGGEDVYQAGKKNVATLYEYWLFLKLKELISSFFEVTPQSEEKLVSVDEDGIDLNLKQGRMTVIYGKSASELRQLNVAFYYNRTFGHVADTQDPVHKAGSWTMAMRPDYTLSIWPGDIDEAEAEREELVVHIHFDAKYRLNKILLSDEKKSAEGTDDRDDLIREKNEQELGIYKRADLLKMHAYKDAIRRTNGAYVLYPGTENKRLEGFHEIIPGLGAFSVRPGAWEEDSVALKAFLSEVKTHMLNRVSAREELSYYQYDVYKASIPRSVMKAPPENVLANMPEPVGENRDFRPRDISVLVGYYQTKEQLNWILEHHLYNARSGDDPGSVSLNRAVTEARYLLLHNSGMSLPLIRLKKGGPKVMTRAQLRGLGYPPHMKEVCIGGIRCKVPDEVRERRESGRIYLVYNLFQSNDAEKELRPYFWRMEDIGFIGQRQARTETRTLEELMLKANKAAKTTLNDRLVNTQKPQIVQNAVLEEIKEAQIPNVIEVDFSSLRVACGYSEDEQVHELIGKISCPRSSKLRQSNGYLVVTASGSSMEPLLHDGQRFVIRLTSSAGNGDVVVIAVGPPDLGGSAAFMLKRLKGGKTCESLNSDCSPFDLVEGCGAHIVGVFVEALLD